MVVPEADVRSGARFVFDIGDQIDPLWNGFVNLEREKQKTCLTLGDIEIEMKESETRFKIGPATWASGLAFDEAVQFLAAALR